MLISTYCLREPTLVQFHVRDLPAIHVDHIWLCWKLDLCCSQWEPPFRRQKLQWLKFTGRFIERVTSRRHNEISGQVAALTMSRINGSIPFKETIEKTTETMPQPLSNNNCYSMTTNKIIATLPETSFLSEMSSFLTSRSTGTVAWLATCNFCGFLHDLQKKVPAKTSSAKIYTTGEIVPCFNEFKKHEWKFGGRKNGLGTRAERQVCPQLFLLWSPKCKQLVCTQAAQAHDATNF